MKNLTRTYLIALIIIGLVITISQLLVQRSIKTASSDGKTINISGRQRMLSQKISKAALAMRNAQTQAQFETRKNELQSALALLQKSHQG
ncbi:MAG: type IV pili methyl-accepting chemotaxis transducer N-terminal domain-containing protein, partial [Cyclobacteriaceae bacterium]|nr:type IV pili methyl-accepting chemotaxis transducer N-terminal domain-containing protein [Cyclobacteriaceae bacterium HetDA_MAG_MS6]